jgi:hypothetical protein
MKIKSISIKDFRNITRSEVSFGKLNVLTGRNSSGKSNFLLALATSLDTTVDHNEVYAGNTVTLSKGKRLTTFSTVIDEIRGMTCYMLNPGIFCIDPKSFTFEKTIDKQNLTKFHRLKFSGRQYASEKVDKEVSKVMEKFEDYGQLYVDSPVYEHDPTQAEQKEGVKVVKVPDQSEQRYFDYFKGLKENIVCNLNTDRPSSAINATAIHDYVTERGDEEIYKQVLQSMNETDKSYRRLPNLKKSKFIFLIADIQKNSEVTKKFESDLNLYTKGVVTKISIDKKGALSVTCPNGPENNLEYFKRNFCTCFLHNPNKLVKPWVHAKKL